MDALFVGGVVESHDDYGRGWRCGLKKASIVCKGIDECHILNQSLYT